MKLSGRIDALFRLLALSTLTVATTACPAAAEPATRADAWGLVTCQAVTVAGHEFCDALGAEWRDKPGSERYTIAIRERPSARWGTQVWIDYAQRRVYQAQLPPARAGLKELGASAAESVYQAILEFERQRQFVRDADLAPDEF
ncbi:CsgE family curli-type amyloid fiber assembly protein [Massilia suwonensis]|uniref:Curli production assembly/transport component CsgE n=1 Tax=Massilia suwonensis TaxID=648895 RepID=A0ABW0MQL0_9BURK